METEEVYVIHAPRKRLRIRRTVFGLGRWKFGGNSPPRSNLITPKLLEWIPEFRGLTLGGTANKPWNFCKNRARDTPLLGVYIPKVRKIFCFGSNSSTPTPMGWNLAWSIDRSSIPARQISSPPSVQRVAPIGQKTQTGTPGTPGNLNMGACAARMLSVMNLLWQVLA